MGPSHSPRRPITETELRTPLTSHTRARAQFLAQISPVDSATADLDSCLGRVIAEDVHADTNVPAFDSSAVDGYAVRAADVELASPDSPVRLQISTSIGPGCCVEIMTGWPMPEGADCALPWEIVEAVGDILVVTKMDSGTNCRPQGEDIQAGETAIAAGTRVDARVVGVLAALGKTQACLRDRPRIAIASTGDEVVAAGATLSNSSVYDSNGPMLAAMLTQAGAEATHKLLPDQPNMIEDWLLETSRTADLIITSGGASVGVHDHVRAALEKLGRVESWRLDLKPGKPTALGWIGWTPVIALPGNPAGALIGGLLFGIGAVNALNGSSTELPTQTFRAGQKLAGDLERTTYAPVELARGLVRALPRKSSVALSILSRADGFAIIPPGGVAAGNDLEVLIQ